MSFDDDLLRLASRVASARRLGVLTGAGVSAASGVPTFRGPAGLWRERRPEDLATPDAFSRDPRLVWEWYAWRRKVIAGCTPNRAHEVLASWSHRHDGFALVTQNVDGLHERAGTRAVLRYHGSIWEVRCVRGCRNSPASWVDERLEWSELPPSCPHCGDLVRPAVVWFGEPIHPQVARAASRIAAGADVFLTIGTSAVVYPAAGLVQEAARRGAFTAEINIEPTPAAAIVDLTVVGPAEVILDRVETLVANQA